nr:MAG TPA: hypothetical protein [Caudoviricetes sp.]
MFQTGKAPSLVRTRRMALFFLCVILITVANLSASLPSFFSFFLRYNLGCLSVGIIF